MTATEQVILVDKDDTPLGTAEKIAAHRNSLCHRAFSVFIYRNKPELQVLLQQRASHKYHSPGLWTNTCCGHPRPGEETLSAATRRLNEEMGIATSLTWAGRFHYIAPFDNGLTENEVDHVFIGTLSKPDFEVNPEEVQAYRWVGLAELHDEINHSAKQFTSWLQQALIIAERNIKS